MLPKPTLIVLLVMLVISCTAEKESPLLSANNLESWKFIVDENTDSVFKTPKGALLKIEKGTFNEKVEVEVKEAYTMRDILLGGLSTTSNGQPLSSGGMIYFDAVNEKELQILKPISVAIPTTFVNTDMQIFKGEESGDSINWINPDTLPDNKIKLAIEQGKRVFQQHCTPCHGIYRAATGPALSGFRQRGPWSSNIELRKWVHNPAAYMAENDYVNNLRQQYGTIMQAFPMLADSVIDAIGAYLDNEQKSPIIDSLSGVEGICSDTLFIPETDIVIDEPDLDPAIFQQEINNMDTTFNPQPLRPTAYIFYISSPGWYNVDILTESLPGAVPCDVEIKISPLDSMHTVELLLPKLKISIPGIFVNGVYVFNKVYKNNLVPGTEAVVVAISNDEDEFYYGALSFVMASKVSLTMSLRKGSKEDFEKLLKENKLDRNEEAPVEENDDNAFEKAFDAIDADQRKDSVKMITIPCNERPKADSTGKVGRGVAERNR